METTIYLVELDADSILVLNSEIIATADQSSKIDLSEMASNLSRALGVPVRSISSQVPDDIKDTWNYGNIIERLIASGDIAAPEKLKTFEVAFTSITGEGYKLPNASSFKANDLPHAIEQLYDSLRGSTEDVLYLDGSMGHLGTKNASALHTVSNNEYFLTPVIGASANIYVGNIQLCINLTAEGLIVDAYPKHGDSDSLSTIGLTWQEACCNLGIDS